MSYYTRNYRKWKEKKRLAIAFLYFIFLPFYSGFKLIAVAAGANIHLYQWSCCPLSSLLQYDKRDAYCCDAFYKTNYVTANALENHATEHSVICEAQSHENLSAAHQFSLPKLEETNACRLRFLNYFLNFKRFAAMLKSQRRHFVPEHSIYSEFLRKAVPCRRERQWVSERVSECWKWNEGYLVYRRIVTASQSFRCLNQFNSGVIYVIKPRSD